MGLVSAMTISPNNKALLAGSLLKKCEKILFLKFHLLHQDNFLTPLICHVTYVTAFNKCVNPGVKHVNLLLFILLARQSQNVRYPPVANIFIYFLFNNRYQNWLPEGRFV